MNEPSAEALSVFESYLSQYEGACFVVCRAEFNVKPYGDPPEAELYERKKELRKQLVDCFLDQCAKARRKL